MRSRWMGALAAAALLAGSSAASAAPADALSIARAAPELQDSSAFASGGGGFTSYLTPINIAIGIGVLAALVFLVVDGDGGNPVTPRPVSP